MVADGRVEDGIVKMRKTLSDPRLGVTAAGALLLPVMAEICGRNGRAEEGLDWLGKGLATAREVGLTVAEAELHRVKGNLLLIKDPDNVPEAQRCFRTAIGAARQQGARLFEIQATASLAHLLK